MPTYRTSAPPTRRPPRMSRAWLVIPAITAALAIWWTQRKADESPPATATEPAATTAERNTTSEQAVAVLKSMHGTYQSLRSYSDRTQIDMRFRRNGEWIIDRAELDVAWQRPDEIAVRVVHGPRQFHVAAANRQVQARIDDPQVPAFNQQVVSQTVGDVIGLATLYDALAVSQPEESGARYSALASLPAPLTLSPLAMILEPAAVDGILQGSTQVQWMPKTTWRGRAVDRVRVTAEEGNFTFWIDSQSYQLHRVEFPAPRGNDPAQQFSLTAQFSDVETDRPMPPARFRFQLPADIQTLQHFVMPPSMQVPRQLGQVIPSLEFTDLWGQAVHSDSWKGKVAVLAWFSNHAPSQGILNELEELAGQTQECTILAVCTEPTTSMSHSDVTDLVRRWNVLIPVVRDLAAVGRDALAIERAPTVAVFDQDQRLQLLEEGGDTQLDKELLVVIQKLHDGDDLARKFRTDQEQRWDRYRAALRAAAALDRRP